MAELKVVLEQACPSSTKGTARTHSIVVDRPEAKGGSDRGPMGGEYLLLAAGGCFSSHLLAAIRARQLPISGVKVTVTGTMDGAPERFTEITLHVTAGCDDEQLRKLATIAGRSCQVLNTLRGGATVSVVCGSSASVIV